MGKHAFLSVLVLTILALTAGIYLSSFRDIPSESTGFEHGVYPWQIELLPSGHTRVFSLTVGKSTLNDAEQLFKERAAITLFVPVKKQLGDAQQDSSGSDSIDGGQVIGSSVSVVEAFFAQVKTGGLKSKMVMSIEVSAKDMEDMYSRGERIETLSGSTRKVTLSDEDGLRVRQLPIAAITYLPSINLQADLIEKRFGQPAEKLPDPESDAIHWLYPSLGLDIVLSEKNKEVIQYVMPNKFDSMVRPLTLNK